MRRPPAPQLPARPGVTLPGVWPTGELQSLRFRVAEQLARAIVNGAHEHAQETAKLLVDIHCRLDATPPPKDVIGWETPRSLGRCAGCGIGLEFRTVGCQTCRSRAHMRAKRAAASAAV